MADKFDKNHCLSTCCKNKTCCNKATCTKACCLNVIKEKLLNKGKELPYPVVLDAPAIGEVINLEDLLDKSYSQRKSGEGFAIRLKANKEAQIFCPVDGVVERTWPTHHAYIITTAENIKILINIGTDNSKMTGEGFQTFVKQGQKVKQGEVLGIVDVDNLSERNINSDVVVLILKSSNYSHIVQTTTGSKLTKRKDLFMVVR